MEIRITGWGYENIRRLNTLDINLISKSDKLPHVTLVMMKNGTGKTTTLNLMRAALSGTATKWTAEQVREFKPINSTNPIGKFYIKIKFGDDPYRYTLILNYECGTITYETSHVGLSGGLEYGHRLPGSMRQVLNSDGFVERFVFDGEQARKTLNAKSREAENAVLYLYQIDKLENLKQKVNDLMQRKQLESASKGATSVSLNNNRTRRENKKRHYESLCNKKLELTEKIKKMEEQQEKLIKQKQELLESNEAVKRQQKELLEEKVSQENSLIESLQNVGRYSVFPYYVSEEFHQRLILLMQNMQTLKLPKTTAREFFKELAESSECICGREIGPKEKETILQRSELYLGAEELSAINVIKDKLRNYTRGSELTDALQEMTKTKEKIQGIQNSLNRLMMQLDEASLKEAEEIQQKLEVIENDINFNKRELAELEAPSGTPRATEENNLQLAYKAYEEADQNYQRALGTYEYTWRAKTLLRYIEITEKLTLSKLKRGIIQKTNEKIAEILPDDPIVVDKIDGSLMLQDRSAVSEGQTLAIAYSYIGSLFEHSSYGFPFIVDSPAASMDLDVRREVATIIPKLFKQLIIFVTSGEVSGFAEKFYSMKNIKYLTIEGQSDGENAICTEGQCYFAAYQSEEVK